MKGFALLLLATTALAVLVPMTSVRGVSDRGSMTVIGELYDYVVREGVRVYIQHSPPTVSGWLGSSQYSITVDYHGTEYRGYLFSVSQAVDISPDGRYVALINYSIRPALYHTVTIREGDAYENRTVVGIDWELVVISGEGRRVALSGTLPASITERGTVPSLDPEWGYPRIAFYGDELYVLSVSIEDGEPVARPYIVSLSQDQLIPLTGVSQAPPSEYMVPIDGSVIVWFVSEVGGMGVEAPTPVLLGQGVTRNLEGVVPSYITGWAGTDAGALIMSADGDLYLIGSDAIPKMIASSAYDFAVSASGEWVAVAGPELSIYRATEAGLESVFTGPESRAVEISDEYVAFMADDAVTVMTLPPNPRVVARVSVADKYFIGDDGIRYGLVYDDLMLEGDGLVIIYHYSPMGSEPWEKIYAAEEIPLPHEQGGTTEEEGGLREIGECSLKISGEVREAAYEGGVLAIVTDSSVEAFRECKRVWGMNFTHPLIDGALNGALFLHNNSLLVKVDMAGGGVVAAYYLPSNLGGYEPSYYQGRVLASGAVVISGLVPGSPFNIVVRGGTYELIPTPVTGLMVASDGAYSLHGTYLKGPMGVAALMADPLTIDVLDGGLALIGYPVPSGTSGVLLSLQDNMTLVTVHGTVLDVSPARVGEYPGVLLLTYDGTAYSTTLIVYTGDSVVAYRVTSTDKMTASYADGVLVTVAGSDGEATAVFYEVIPP